jgi:hypothetical protein
LKRESLKEQVIANKAFKKYKRILNAVVAQFNPVEVEKEAKTMHAGRLVRSLDPKKMNPRTLIEANVREISYRSRFVEIRVSMTSHRTHLGQVITAVRRYLVSEYGSESGIKTISERKQYFDRYFREGEQIVAEIDYLLDMLDRFVQDIDQAGFALKRTQDLIEMIYVREKSI